MSVGVNIAPQWSDTVEGKDIPRMERLLADLRPSAVRFVWVDATKDGGRIAETIRFCNANAIEVALIDNGAYTPEQFVSGVSYLTSQGLIVSHLEGLNEPDAPTVGGSAPVALSAAKLASLTDRQTRLYNAVAERWPVLSMAGYGTINESLLIGMPCDIANVHRYPDIYGAPPSPDKAQLPDTAKPIWVTETGIPTRKVCTASFLWWCLSSKYQVTEAQQAQWLPQFRDMLTANGAERVFIYRLINAGSDLFNPEQNFGLYRWDGSAKPAVAALRG